ncbi:hypothetical protein Ahia01_000725100 [Argonauta hians]
MAVKHPMSGTILSIVSSTLLLIALLPPDQVKAVKEKAFNSQKCFYSFNLERNSLKVTCDQSGNLTDFPSERSQRRHESRNSEGKEELDKDSDGFDVSYAPSGKPYMIRRAIKQTIDVPRILFTVPNNESQTTVPDLEWIRNNSRGFLQRESQLINFVDQLKNASKILKDGNLGLKRRLRRLVEIRNGAVFFPTEGNEMYITYLQNQQHFVNSQFALQTRLIADLTTKVQAITELTHSVFDKLISVTEEQEKGVQYLGRTLVALKEDVASGTRNTKISSANVKYNDNCDSETVVGFADMVDSINVGVRKGALMRDVIPENFGKTWLMYGDSGSNTLVEYNSQLALIHELVSKTYELPFHCEGNGEAIYKNALYCLKAKTNIIIRYDLGGSDFIDEYPLEGAGVNNKYPYLNNNLSDVDFAVDESGLWVTYSTLEADGKVVMGKLNENTMVLEKTWSTNFPKKLLLNSFIICGVLYGVEAPPSSHAFVRYTYDTRSGVDNVLGVNDMVLPLINHNDRVAVSMLDYNPAEKVLHVWNDYGHVESYPVLFNSKE